jgi:hypothetical protein
MQKRVEIAGLIIVIIIIVLSALFFLSAGTTIQQQIVFEDMTLEKTIFLSNNRVETYEFNLTNPIIGYLVVPKTIATSANEIMISGDFNITVIRDDPIIKITSKELTPGTKKLIITSPLGDTNQTTILFPFPLAEYNNLNDAEKLQLETTITGFAQSVPQTFTIDKSIEIMQQYANDIKSQTSGELKESEDGIKKKLLFAGPSTTLAQAINTIQQFTTIVQTITDNTNPQSNLLDSSSIFEQALSSIQNLTIQAPANFEDEPVTMTITFKPEPAQAITQSYEIPKELVLQYTGNEEKVMWNGIIEKEEIYPVPEGTTLALTGPDNFRLEYIRLTEQETNPNKARYAVTITVDTTKYYGEEIEENISLSHNTLLSQKEHTKLTIIYNSCSKTPQHYQKFYSDSDAKKEKDYFHESARECISNNAFSELTNTLNTTTLNPLTDNTISPRIMNGALNYDNASYSASTDNALVKEYNKRSIQATLDYATENAKLQKIYDKCTTLVYSALQDLDRIESKTTNKTTLSKINKNKKQLLLKLAEIKMWLDPTKKENLDTLTNAQLEYLATFDGNLTRASKKWIEIEEKIRKEYETHFGNWAVDGMLKVKQQIRLVEDELHELEVAFAAFFIDRAVGMHAQNSDFALFIEDGYLYDKSQPRYNARENILLREIIRWEAFRPDVSSITHSTTSVDEVVQKIKEYETMIDVKIDIKSFEEPTNTFIDAFRTEENQSFRKFDQRKDSLRSAIKNKMNELTGLNLIAQRMYFEAYNKNKLDWFNPENKTDITYTWVNFSKGNNSLLDVFESDINDFREWSIKEVHGYEFSLIQEALDAAFRGPLKNEIEILKHMKFRKFVNKSITRAEQLQAETMFIQSVIDNQKILITAKLKEAEDETKINYVLYYLVTNITQDTVLTTDELKEMWNTIDGLKAIKEKLLEGRTILGVYNETKNYFDKKGISFEKPELQITTYELNIEARMGSQTNLPSNTTTVTNQHEINTWNGEFLKLDKNAQVLQKGLSHPLMKIEIEKQLLTKANQEKNKKAILAAKTEKERIQLILSDEESANIALQIADYYYGEEIWDSALQEYFFIENYFPNTSSNVTAQEQIDKLTKTWNPKFLLGQRYWKNFGKITREFISLRAIATYLAFYGANKLAQMQYVDDAGQLTQKGPVKVTCSSPCKIGNAQNTPPKTTQTIDDFDSLLQREFKPTPKPTPPAWKAKPKYTTDWKRHGPGTDWEKMSHGRAVLAPRTAVERWTEIGRGNPEVGLIMDQPFIERAAHASTTTLTEIEVALGEAQTALASIRRINAVIEPTISVSGISVAGQAASALEIQQIVYPNLASAVVMATADNEIGTTKLTIVSPTPLEVLAENIEINEEIITIEVADHAEPKTVQEKAFQTEQKANRGVVAKAKITPAEDFVGASVANELDTFTQVEQDMRNDAPSATQTSEYTPPFATVEELTASPEFQTLLTHLSKKGPIDSERLLELLNAFDVEFNEADRVSILSVESFRDLFADGFIDETDAENLISLAINYFVLVDHFDVQEYLDYKKRRVQALIENKDRLTAYIAGRDIGETQKINEALAKLVANPKDLDNWNAFYYSLRGFQRDLTEEQALQVLDAFQRTGYFGEAIPATELDVENPLDSTPAIMQALTNPTEIYIDGLETRSEELFKITIILKKLFNYSYFGIQQRNLTNTNALLGKWLAARIAAVESEPGTAEFIRGNPASMTSNAPEITALLSDNAKARALLEGLTTLRTIYPKAEKNTELSENEQRIWISDNVFVRVDTSSFRRHLLVETNDAGEVIASVEIKIPGAYVHKLKVGTSDYDKAELLAPAFGEDMQRGIAVINYAPGEYSWYGQIMSFGEHTPMQIVVSEFDYEAFQKRRRLNEFLSSESITSAEAQTIETQVIALMEKVFENNWTGNGDLSHLQNFTIERLTNGTLKIRFVNDLAEFKPMSSMSETEIRNSLDQSRYKIANALEKQLEQARNKAPEENVLDLPVAISDCANGCTVTAQTSALVASPGQANLAEQSGSTIRVTDFDRVEKIEIARAVDTEERLTFNFDSPILPGNTVFVYLETPEWASGQECPNLIAPDGSINITEDVVSSAKTVTTACFRTPTNTVDFIWPNFSGGLSNPTNIDNVTYTRDIISKKEFFLGIARHEVLHAWFFTLPDKDLAEFLGIVRDTVGFSGTQYLFDSRDWANGYFSEGIEPGTNPEIDLFIASQGQNGNKVFAFDGVQDEPRDAMRVVGEYISVTVQKEGFNYLPKEWREFMAKRGVTEKELKKLTNDIYAALNSHPQLAGDFEESTTAIQRFLHNKIGFTCNSPCEWNPPATMATETIELRRSEGRVNINPSVNGIEITGQSRGNVSETIIRHYRTSEVEGLVAQKAAFLNESELALAREGFGLGFVVSIFEPDGTKQKIVAHFPKAVQAQTTTEPNTTLIEVENVDATPEIIRNEIERKLMAANIMTNSVINVTTKNGDTYEVVFLWTQERGLFGETIRSAYTQFPFESIRTIEVTDEFGIFTRAGTEDAKNNKTIRAQIETLFDQTDINPGDTIELTSIRGNTRTVEYESLGEFGLQIITGGEGATYRFDSFFKVRKVSLEPSTNTRLSPTQLVAQVTATIGSGVLTPARRLEAEQEIVRAIAPAYGIGIKFLFENRGVGSIVRHDAGNAAIGIYGYLRSIAQSDSIASSDATATLQEFEAYYTLGNSDHELGQFKTRSAGIWDEKPANEMVAQDAELIDSLRDFDAHTQSAIEAVRNFVSRNQGVVEARTLEMLTTNAETLETRIGFLLWPSEVIVQSALEGGRRVCGNECTYNVVGSAGLLETWVPLDTTIDNLVQNSVKALGEAKTSGRVETERELDVKVTVGEIIEPDNRRHLEITYQDNAGGIDRDALVAKLNELGTRNVDPNDEEFVEEIMRRGVTTGGEGHGEGLYAVRMTLAEFGGGISVKEITHPNGEKGLEFTIKVPVGATGETTTPNLELSTLETLPAPMYALDERFLFNQGDRVFSTDGANPAIFESREVFIEELAITLPNGEQRFFNKIGEGKSSVHLADGVEVQDHGFGLTVTVSEAVRERVEINGSAISEEKRDPSTPNQFYYYLEEGSTVTIDDQTFRFARLNRTREYYDFFSEVMGLTITPESRVLIVPDSAFDNAFSKLEPGQTHSPDGFASRTKNIAVIKASMVNPNTGHTTESLATLKRVGKHESRHHYIHNASQEFVGAIYGAIEVNIITIPYYQQLQPERQLYFKSTGNRAIDLLFQDFLEAHPTYVSHAVTKDGYIHQGFLFAELTTHFSDYVNGANNFTLQQITFFKRISPLMNNIESYLELAAQDGMRNLIQKEPLIAPPKY